jgi:hypothetical protein
VNLVLIGFILKCKGNDHRSYEMGVPLKITPMFIPFPFLNSFNF